MKAFVNSKQTKSQAVEMMKEHHRLDHIIKGTYGQGSIENGDFKACMIGCATNGNHDAFEPEFGIPWRVAWLADDIFEGLEAKEGADFTVEFFESVKEGSDLSKVYDKWCAWMLSDPENGLVKITEEPSVFEMGKLFVRA